MSVADVLIQVVLSERGYLSLDHAAKARGVLEASGLTNLRKTRIAVEKLRRIDALLAETFALRCGECAYRVVENNGREVLTVRDSLCAECGGSASLRVMKRIALLRPTLRVVTVGGSPRARNEMGPLMRGVISLRSVDGTVRRTKEQAWADYAWADVVVIWASTELKHRISGLYKDVPDASGKTITLARRGVAAMCEALLTWCERHPLVK